MYKKLVSAPILTLLFLMCFSVKAQERLWSSTSKDLVNKYVFKQDSYKVSDLKFTKLKEQLKSARKKVVKNTLNGTIISFPNAEGKSEQFSVVETQVMSSEIAAQYPQIKTYVGVAIDNSGARVRFTVSPQGVQTMTTYKDKPSVFTVPIEKGNTRQYITYQKNSVKDRGQLQCLVDDKLNTNSNSFDKFKKDANDQTLRTFRIAISTTGEYTTRWDDGNAGNGDKQTDAMAQVVATLNRINEVFEVDMAVTFQLVTGTSILYPDASTDPYSSDNSYSSELQSTLTSEVGEANYDIGHLFNHGSDNGYAGCIGCVCVDNQKGGGFSSANFTSTGFLTDYFDIDLVAHEIGHQMGANHTFSFENEEEGVNVEPGSGSTIMGYAGYVGSDDVQAHSDPYFHYVSIKQILDNLDTKSCYTTTAIANNPPVANAGSDYTIPQGTAFVLKGSATDSDGSDVLTYTWEQIDDGGKGTSVTQSNFGPTLTVGPLFRSHPPSTKSDRYMPVFSRVLSGQLTETNPVKNAQNTSWETVSTVGRTLNFALTVRDRSLSEGTGQFPQSDFDLTTITVDGASGPFSVTSQNTNIVWKEDENQPIIWSVNGTDSGSVNAATVTIKLSIDRGMTFPYTLAANTPNDGSQTITVPDIGDTIINGKARLLVEADGNIFYAVNSSFFTIEPTTASTDDFTFNDFKLYPNPSSGLFTLQFDPINTEKVHVELYDITGRRIVQKNFTNIAARFSEQIDFSNTATGVYIIRVHNGAKFTTRRVVIE